MPVLKRRRECKINGGVDRGVWMQEKHPKDKPALGTEDVFRTKLGMERHFKKYKDRFVAQNFHGGPKRPLLEVFFLLDNDRREYTDGYFPPINMDMSCDRSTWNRGACRQMLRRPTSTSRGLP